MNRQFRLKRRPVGRVTREDFDLVEAPVPEPAEGQAVIRNLYLSLDPTNRIWMSDQPQYMPPVAIGEVMRGGGIGRVVASRNPAYREGDLVNGILGWQDYYVAGAPGEMFAPSVIPDGLPIPLPTLMGACGMTGLTAYFGLTEIGQPKPGETVVVSAAAGAVGSVVGQVAKILGARVVGIAGGAAKCAFITGELGFDAAVDYKAPDWREQLKAATPNGIDVNFENVGGEIMEAVVARMNLYSRMPLCGMISTYNDAQRPRYDLSPFLMKRIRLQGFIILDFKDRYIEGSMQLAQWLMEGKLKARETVVEGLDKAPEALNMLFDGSNIGKLIVKI
ncbi:MAG: NADP-dependent oxidoreductase [Zavarzinia sp.]|nr:NADP-dependent oxidoreductase [Zavarzinia sp.]